VVPGLDPAAPKQGRSIVEATLGAIHEADQNGGAIGRLAGQLLEGFQVVPDEPGAKHQVLRRVSGNGQLREAHQVGAVATGLPGPGRHLLDVPREVADGDVQLPEGDPHDLSVSRPSPRGPEARK
jgi:hypothetical protein